MNIVCHLLNKCQRFFLFFKDLIYSFLERGKEGEREGEKYQCVVTSRAPCTEDLACNPGMCPDWESNWQPFGSQPTLNPLSYTSQDSKIVFLKYCLITGN